MRAHRVVLWVGTVLALSSAPAAAGPILWMDVTGGAIGNAGTANGTLGAISVQYLGDVESPSQASCGTNYYAPATPYLSATVDNAPTGCDIIALQGGLTAPNTLTFSAPVTNPVMAIVSLGQLGLPVFYDFDRPFDILSVGAGFWGNGTLTELAGDVLEGREGHGVIQFLGTFSSISWTASPSEFWHGFNVGIADTAVVPEPATMSLLGIGLAAIGIRRLRRRK